MRENEEVPGNDNPIENQNFNKQKAVGFQKKILGAKPYGLKTAFHVSYQILSADGKYVDKFGAVATRDQLPANAQNTAEYAENQAMSAPFKGASGNMVEQFHTHGDAKSFHAGVPVSFRKVE